MWTGLSEPNGSWNIICTSDAVLQRGAARLVLEDIASLEDDLAAVGGISRAISRAVVLLPLPDSPTSASDAGRAGA